MSRKLLIAGAVAAVSAAAFFSTAQANPVAGISSTDPVAQSVVVKTGPFHCAKSSAVCRGRWGFGWRYRRCMRNHGC